MSLTSFIPIIGPAVEKLLDLIPDKNARERAEEEYRRALLEAQLAEANGQREINKIEAGHRSIWVAGWRPFIGWVCGLSVACAFLLFPVANAFLSVVMPERLALLPVFPMDYLLELLFGMLGL
ncbi:MAG: hypothetical protein IJD04_05965, partial [Desulfovibrionaceae bacterium]|nr:hypothetical protein [Desulfovibrionaceae bacterium]